MQRNIGKQVSSVLLHFSFLMGLYTIFRIVFYTFNRSDFESIDHSVLIAYLIGGLRFDFSILVLVNILWLFVYSLPIPKLLFKPCVQKLLHISFTFLNGIPILFEISDWVYFKYNHKRATAEIFNLLGNQGDFINLLPSFLRDYWYLFIVAVLILWGIYKTTQWISNWSVSHFNSIQSTIKYYLLSGVWFLLVAGSIVLGIRGGLQYVPISIKDALLVAPPQHAAIVLNTPFSIYKSLKRDVLEPIEYYDDATLYQVLNTQKDYFNKELPIKKMNVVVIILESYSKEFTKLNGTTSYTPFLDSLMDKSLTFTNAYANGLHSNEGIPSVLSGIPSLLNSVITKSNYSTNQINSLASLLAKEQYQSSFFHGATNGSMNFDIYAKGAAFDRYFGRKEYDNEQDYDGNWGIFDVPFLEYFNQQLGAQSAPFVSAIFTLSSHPPYTVEKGFEQRFPKGTLPIHETVGYTDNALRLFFEKAQQSDWYSNTLFVITADHCAPEASNTFYKTGAGRYQIPMLFFAPNDSTLSGFNGQLMSQIDILPSILDYLNYPYPFYALGQSVFDSTVTHYSIAKLDNTYDWHTNDGLWMKITNENEYQVFDMKTDSAMKHNLTTEPKYSHSIAQSLRLWKAFMQHYNNDLIADRMYLK